MNSVVSSAGSNMKYSSNPQTDVHQLKNYRFRNVSLHYSAIVNNIKCYTAESLEFPTTYLTAEQF